jgi:hypothetical protein
MKGYVTALGLLLLGAAGAANATTAVIDFNTPGMTTANTQLITNGPMSKPTMLNVGGRNAVQTGGTSDNEFLYIALPKGVFKGAKGIWATVEYYDQGTGTFQLHYDAGTDPSTLDMTTGQAHIVGHDTKAWLTQSWHLVGADFQEAGPGGADVWIDDEASGSPAIIDRITVTDEDPTLRHWPHVDPSHKVTIDGKIDPGEWDNAFHFTVDSASQDALRGANWAGPQDFSGTYYFEWDENGVYVRGDVTDATPRLNDAGGNPPNYWNGDGFQIYLGLDWSDPTHTTYVDTDHDIYVGLGDGMNGSLPPSWADEWGAGPTVTDWSNAGAAPIPAANLAIHNTTSPKGYQFEFFLPWAMMLADDSSKAKITPGQTMGFYFYANNSTEIGPSAQQVAMQPFGLTGQYENASHFTTVVLDPAPAQPATNPGGTNPTAGQ